MMIFQKKEEMKKTTKRLEMVRCQSESIKNKVYLDKTYNKISKFRRSFKLIV